MTNRSAPAHILGPEISELEAELAAACAACPPRQRVALETLRRRLEQLKVAAQIPQPAGSSPTRPAPR